MKLNEFVKWKRNNLKFTQPKLALKAGVGLGFVREPEQGKEALRLDKVNPILRLFGHRVGLLELKENN